MFSISLHRRLVHAIGVLFQLAISRRLTTYITIEGEQGNWGAVEAGGVGSVIDLLLPYALYSSLKRCLRALSAPRRNGVEHLGRAHFRNASSVR